VPTWNYVAVHLRGSLESLPEDALAPMLGRLSAHFEATLAPKPAWTSDKMTKGVMERMMRAIAPCRLMVDQIDSTWKLNQTSPQRRVWGPRRRSPTRAGGADARPARPLAGR
jgi:transcriptional regulator